MFYRILIAPPGYPAHQKYMVSEYSSLEYKSYCGSLEDVDGSGFFATLEDARKAIPGDVRQLPFRPDRQFVELWESPESGA
jgi:hypothetical protein